MPSAKLLALTLATTLLAAHSAPARAELSLTFGGATTLLAAHSAPARAELSLTFGGDMNFNSSRVAPRPDGAKKGGKVYSFKSLLAGIAPYLDGDINFANVETVISERDLPDTRGTFVFNSHPNAIRAATDAGFNLFNLANNHIGDHGQAGMDETLRNMGALAKERGFAWGGLGADREDALEPVVFTTRTATGTYRIAFLAMTGVANTPTQATANKPGVLYLRDPQDFKDAMKKMAAVRADYKILSFHWGTEGKATLDGGQRALYQRALREGDADLILGHHPHRVRPVEHVGDKVIFYSLGNYLMLGAANINAQSDVLDYGLLGKLHLEYDAAKKRLVAQAAEMIPIYDMHLNPKALGKDEATRRVKALNSVGKGQLGADNVEFRVNRKGFGSSCLGSNPGARAAVICNNQD
ncbi:MAG: CapA family protein [Proteobacteria bacterium]|nr:MAG: CapA family protein [Pseudomonadota bacterium]